jgi:hypothetical protein
VRRPRSGYGGAVLVVVSHLRLVNAAEPHTLKTWVDHVGRPRDHIDAAEALAREIADIAGQLASLNGEANSWLRDPNYDTLKLRLENAHPAVEARPIRLRVPMVAVGGSAGRCRRALVAVLRSSTGGCVR